MNKLLNSLTFAGLLSLSTQSSGIVHEVGIEVIDSKEQVGKVLATSKQEIISNQESKEFIKETQFFSDLLDIVTKNQDISDETKVELLVMFTDDDFRKQIFSLLKENLNENNFEIVLKSLFL